MNIGFIGAGTMGQPMVANLLRKGFPVVARKCFPFSLLSPRIPSIWPQMLLPSHAELT